MIIGKEKNKENKANNPPKHSFLVTATRDCLQVDKNRINFCKYPIFASSHKQIVITVEMMNFFAEHQRKDFHMLSIKADSDFKSTNSVFTFKLVDSGEEVTQLELPMKEN